MEIQGFSDLLLLSHPGCHSRLPAVGRRKRESRTAGIKPEFLLQKE